MSLEQLLFSTLMWLFLSEAKRKARDDKGTAGLGRREVGGVLGNRVEGCGTGVYTSSPAVFWIGGALAVMTRMFLVVCRTQT